MRLPLTYSLRNLRRRPWRTAMTAGGIFLVVFAAVLMLSLSRGIAVRTAATGEPANLLVISRKGENAMFSAVEEDEVVHLRNLPAAARGTDGGPLVSPELMHVSTVECAGRRAPVSVRGVQPIAYEVHRCVRVTGGRLPEGSFEILAGETSHVKLGVPAEALAPGKKVTFEGRDWTICGTFEAGGSLFESEFWTKESDLQTVLRRRTHSFAVVRLESSARAPEALAAFSRTGALQKYFKGWTEAAYYRDFTGGIAWIRWLATAMVLVITVAGALIGVNTMYTAMISRTREIATQRVLGFSRTDILFSLTVESAAVSLLAGAVGAAGGLLLNGFAMRLSQAAFFLVADLPVVAVGIGLALFVGVAGALLPAAHGLRLNIARALRRA
ncbi:MAG: ABC transporter permease [Planctomycetota bacterium]|jgi:ABC-type lipoprotein release transport system permease subunit